MGCIFCCCAVERHVFTLESLTLLSQKPECKDILTIVPRTSSHILSQKIPTEKGVCCCLCDNPFMLSSVTAKTVQDYITAYGASPIVRLSFSDLYGEHLRNKLQEYHL